jgi:hypothetical protein
MSEKGLIKKTDEPLVKGEGTKTALNYSHK